MPDDSGSRTLIHVTLLCAVSAALLLPGLGQTTSLNGREVRHAEIAREMAETGQWAVPVSLGHPFNEKPPLFHWAAATVFTLTGRADWVTARLPSVLAAAAAAIAVYFLGRRWAGPRTGLVAGMLWLCFPLTVMWGRMARMDVMMTALFVCSVAFAAWSADAEERWTAGRIWLLRVASALLLTGAVMAKGPQPLFYFAVAAVAIWRARRRRWLPPLPFMALCIVMTLAAFTYWLSAAESTDPGHLRELFGYELDRAVSEEHATKRITLYVDQTILWTAPWCVFALGAAWSVARRMRRTGYDVSMIPAVVFAAAFVGMTLFPNKRPHYLLPVFPFWALFIAAYLDRAPDDPAAHGPHRLFLWPLGAALAFSAVAGPPALVWLGLTLDGVLSVLLCAAVTVTAVAGLLALLHRRTRPATYALLAVFVALVSTGSWLDVSANCPPDRRVAAAERAARLLPPDLPVAAYRVPFTQSFETFFFALGRPVRFIQAKNGEQADGQFGTYLADNAAETDLQRFLLSPGPRAVLLQPAAARQIMPLLPAGATRKASFVLNITQKGTTSIELWMTAAP